MCTPAHVVFKPTNIRIVNDKTAQPGQLGVGLFTFVAQSQATIFVWFAYPCTCTHTLQTSVNVKTNKQTNKHDNQPSNQPTKQTQQTNNQTNNKQTTNFKLAAAVQLHLWLQEYAHAYMQVPRSAYDIPLVRKQLTHVQLHSYVRLPFRSPPPP